MRKFIKAPLTNNALELSIKQLEKLAPSNVAKQIEIVQQSVMKSWKGLFQVKDLSTSDNQYNALSSNGQQKISKADEEFINEQN